MTEGQTVPKSRGGSLAVRNLSLKIAFVMISLANY